jgi:2,4-dienoyl-CoA reductase-like NADH-dependent reductase (Old Yellow Enzyme family)
VRHPNGQLRTRHRFLAPRAFLGAFFVACLAVWAMLKCSSFLPALIAAASQRGFNPRPAQVSLGFSGLRYFAATGRASAGLIISEATQISPEGQGYISTPGIHSNEQIEGWRIVAKAVRVAGGCMVLQLWHVGRISHPSFQPGGALPVAPSTIKPNARAFTNKGFEPIPMPRALETEEVGGIVRQYAKAAQNAMAAGFDGVEVHAANGYLIDQFLRDRTNKRSDQYGGSIENRTRFLLEVMDAVTSVVGRDRVGVRISPQNTQNTSTTVIPKPSSIMSRRASRTGPPTYTSSKAIRPAIRCRRLVTWR